MWLTKENLIDCLSLQDFPAPCDSLLCDLELQIRSPTNEWVTDNDSFGSDSPDGRNSRSFLPKTFLLFATPSACFVGSAAANYGGSITWRMGNKRPSCRFPDHVNELCERTSLKLHWHEYSSRHSCRTHFHWTWFSSHAHAPPHLMLLAVLLVFTFCSPTRH